MIRTVRRLALVTAVAGLSLSSVAQAACPTAGISQPFKRFGDSNYYTLAPGAAFEQGMVAWTLSGSLVVSGNESYFLNGADDSAALKVKAGSVSVSPSFCVSAATPTLLLMAQKPTTTTGQLKVELLYRTASGDTKTALAGLIANGAKGDFASTWKPSAALKLTTALPISTSPDGTMIVQIRLTADKGGDWLADDIYIDPRMY